MEFILLCLMCWSKACRPYARALWPWAMSVIIVEFCEGLSWPYVIDLSDRLENQVKCPLLNSVLTQIIFGAVYCQPLALTNFALRTPPGMKHPHRNELNLLRLLSLLFLLGMCAAHTVTFLTDAEDRVYELDGHGAVVLPRGWSYATTCAYKGPQGNQVWQAAWANRFRDILPNAFTYLLNGAVAICLLYDKIEAMAWLLFMALFVIASSVYWLWFAGSTWCFYGLLIFVFYTVFPNIKERYSICAVPSWYDLLPCWRSSCAPDVESDSIAKPKCLMLPCHLVSTPQTEFSDEQGTAASQHCTACMK